MDKRFRAYNNRVAAIDLKGQISHHTFVQSEDCHIGVPVCDLLDEPNGKRQRQLIYGAFVEVFEHHNNWSFVRHKSDGYVGYVPSDELAKHPIPTHFVSNTLTHCYQGADIKVPDLYQIPMLANVAVERVVGAFSLTALGWVPSQHLTSLDAPKPDPVDVAYSFLGTPYLWGGNTALGIDCSGLVQVAFAACGLRAPADSDLQCVHLGLSVRDDPKRGDLLFWRGHVALVYDADHIIHANAHTMSVAIESTFDAIKRIENSGSGPLIAHKRMKG